VVDTGSICCIFQHSAQTMKAGQRHRLLFMLMAALVMTLQGCASGPADPPRNSSQPGGSALPPHPGATIAASLVGTPYRYGGSSPRGFDCSGLVYYSYRKAGIHVPRTTTSQLNNSLPVPLQQVQAGDLLFFKLSRRAVSHVGIYAGNGQFIHAPSRGKKVSITPVNDPYWQQRLVAAGRYY
jgi:cell wall-associated NlpC family hydrolase